jgi:hypothetical protein
MTAPSKLSAANGARRKSPQHLRRLAHLVTLLDQRRQRREEFADLLERVQRGGLMTVVGEEALLAAIDVRLTDAAQQLTNLEQAKSTAAAMSALETVLEGYEWEVVDQTLPLLEQKRESQRAIIDDLQARVDEWRNRIDPLRLELQQADSVRAPVPIERSALKRLDSLLAQAERAFFDQRYGDVADPLGRLDAEGKPDELVDKVRTKAVNAENFNRQADVLLLRTIAEDLMNSYTVLLRTPSEPGSHGINIQDDSCIVHQDRAYVREVIDKVTKAVDDGIARRYYGGSSEPPATAAAAGNGEPAAAQQEVREWRPDAGVQPFDRGGSLHEDLGSLIGEVGNVMFRLFMPEQMRDYLAKTPCALTITTNDLELPWELMYDRGWEQEESERGQGFLCLQRPMARMPMGRAFPRVRPPTRQKKQLRFLLVYADPTRNLAAAGREIEQIQAAFSGRDEIEVSTLRLEQANGKALNQALLSGTYDVIHYAGHAYFDTKAPDRSGLVLHDEEIFLSEKIQRFVEGQPLVFLNACQTGRTANEAAPQAVNEYFWKPAEGLASALLYGGALGCVGSLWPVYDEPAGEFAVEFYNQVLEGQMIGEAMRIARRAIKREHPESITWAAFVLYGDPTFQLVR